MPSGPYRRTIALRKFCHAALSWAESIGGRAQSFASPTHFGLPQTVGKILIPRAARRPTCLSVWPQLKPVADVGWIVCQGTRYRTVRTWTALRPIRSLVSRVDGCCAMPKNSERTDAAPAVAGTSSAPASSARTIPAQARDRRERRGFTAPNAKPFVQQRLSILPPNLPGPCTAGPYHLSGATGSDEPGRPRLPRREGNRCPDP